METSYRETPIGRPSFAMEVLAPPLILSAAAYVAVAYAGNRNHAQLAAAIVCIIVLLYRLYMWDTEGRPVNIVERTRYLDDEPAPTLRPIVASDDRHRLVMGKFEWTESEWRRVGRVLASGKLTREPLRDLQLDDGSPIFTALNDKYGDIVAEFQRIGFVNEDNETTERFYEWYDEHGIPLPNDVR